LCAGVAWSAPARALQIPILVQELLPAGTNGHPRVAEPVSVGVPLDAGEGITDIGQLGLFGAGAAQFRVLERDRDTRRIRWVLVAGARYESGLDGGSQVVIEENGPVKAVIRARGILRSVTGAMSLDYTVRLQFYRGKAACRAFVTLRNADLDSAKPRLFDAAW